MSEITHKEARKLLQAAADQILNPEEKSILDMHLSQCQDCNEYANYLSTLEVSLRRVFHTQLDYHKPATPDLKAILNPAPIKLVWNSLFGPSSVMGKAAIVIVLMIGYFVVANLFGIQTPIASNGTATILPTPSEFLSAYVQSPTPSAQFTLTGSILQACETTIYRVQENDTLEFIAYQHRISQESILDYNHLNSNTVFTGMELVIPLCNNTPSRTATIPNNTITITPLNETILPTQPQ